MTILRYCGLAIITAITICIIYILCVAVVYATKKAIIEKKEGK